MSYRTLERKNDMSEIEYMAMKIGNSINDLQSRITTLEQENEELKEACNAFLKYEKLHCFFTVPENVIQSTRQAMEGKK